MPHLSDSGRKRREQPMKFGPQVLRDGVRFRLWAPMTDAVSVQIDELDLTYAMEKRPRGWFEFTAEGAKVGMHYRFILADGQVVPDPAARYLPDDVSGRSEIVDPLSFEWTDRGWTGRPWEETIIYEMHIGTFTPEGTFRAAIDKLDHLVALGINTVEVLPVADFHGRWNWGYDGASLFAVDSVYGRPEDFKAFVNAAHDKGLSVILDVVYNHFGPRGNHIEAYAPLTTGDVDTPWGAAINFDDEGSAMVRNFVMANARFWLNEYHIDGLRLDATHEIYDSGPRHVLMELAEQCRAATDGRHVHLVLENSQNHANWLKRLHEGAPWLYNAQWADDVHHAFHSLITGDATGYFADFENRTDLAGRSLAEGFGWQGEYMERAGRHKGEPSAYLPPTAFVAFMQNHDQIGNRPLGERLNHIVSMEAVRMRAAINLLSPQIPLLFMGEEWAASTPFLFFSDIGDDLADAIREGRKDEAKNWPNVDSEHLPDPMDESTFLQSKLRWEEIGEAEHARTLDLYRRLLAIRQAEIIPRLPGMDGFSGSYELLGSRVIRVRWTLNDGSTLELVANVSAERAEVADLVQDHLLHIEGSVDAQGMAGWTAMFRLVPAD